MEDLPYVPVTSLDGPDGLQAADIIVLATPVSGLPSLVQSYGHVLREKVDPGCCTGLLF